jgi:hypothetical protein
MTFYPSDAKTALPATEAADPALGRASFLAELVQYLRRFREFDREDWLVYVLWVGLMVSLVLATTGFLILGQLAGAIFPREAWLVPTGAAIFSAAIAVDTIGHRTVYKQVIGEAEGLVHHVTIFCGIGSCVILCAAFRFAAELWIPALVLTVMSFVYSLIDEAFHWRRYINQTSDRVEMWSHAFISLGHLTMMIAWWRWFWLGYPGVRETLSLIGGAR